MSPRILLAAHGFPPRENAGTEQYTARLAGALRARGWEVCVFAATQSPGGAMYGTRHEVLADGVRVVRIVNNAPFAGRRAGGADAAIDTAFARVCDDVHPDLIHLQHVGSLSTTLPLPAPTIWTLHDAWAWCPAGGLLLRDGAACGGPGPGCPACASNAQRDSRAVAAALGMAGRLSSLLPAERLHHAWKRLPAAWRDAVTRAPGAPLTERDMGAWRGAHLALARRCAAVVSPSEWLANAAREAGFPPITVLGHGVDTLGAGGGPPATPPPIPSAPAPFVFLGTIAPHKGADVVQAAWRLAGVPNRLDVYGPPGADAAYAARVGGRGPLAADAVPGVLASAQALVLGSIWPENAPLVILEARAAGCPVIAPAIGGIPELVAAGRDGWLYPPGEVGPLAAAMTAAAATRIVPTPPRSFRAHVEDLLGVYDHARGPRRARAGAPSRSESTDE